MGTTEKLVEEHFAPVDGFPNYEVSNFGRIVNSRGMELRSRVDANGFCNVALYANRKRRDFVVHRLVAQAFFVDYSDDLEVKHISDDRTDNSVRNLTLGPPLRIKVRIKETGREFESLEACGRYLGGKSAHVARALYGQTPGYMGYTFEVVDRVVAS